MFFFQTLIAFNETDSARFDRLYGDRSFEWLLPVRDPADAFFHGRRRQPSLRNLLTVRLTGTLLIQQRFRKDKRSI